MHGKNNYYQAKRLIDLEKLRQILLRTVENRNKQKDIFNALYYKNIQKVGRWDLIDLKERVVSLKLDPLNHPFKENLLSLCVRGCISSVISPEMRCRGRVLFIFWFTAMLFVPKTIAKPLTEKLLYPEQRRQFIKTIFSVRNYKGKT